MQDYFHLFGSPRHEDRQLHGVWRAVDLDASASGIQRTLAVIPDLPYLNGMNLHLHSRFQWTPVRTVHPFLASWKVYPLDGVDYVVSSARDQGMACTTRDNRQIARILRQANTLRLVEQFASPNGDCATPYRIQKRNSTGMELQ